MLIEMWGRLSRCQEAVLVRCEEHQLALITQTAMNLIRNGIAVEMLRVDEKSLPQLDMIDAEEVPTRFSWIYERLEESK